jgi:uncharacterized protein
LLENGIFPGLMCVVTNNNIEGLLALTRFSIENNLNLRLSFVQGEQINTSILIPALYQCSDLYSKAIEKGFNFSKLHRLCDLKTLKPFFQTCCNGFDGGALYVDGEIYFCHKLFGIDASNGSIFEDNDLLAIIQRKTYYNNVHSDCLKCSLRYICTSGCPLERNNGKDIYCEVYKEMLPVIYKLYGKERLVKLKKQLHREISPFYFRKRKGGENMDAMLELSFNDILYHNEETVNYDCSACKCECGDSDCCDCHCQCSK